MGLSVIPIGSQKIPLGPWKVNMVDVMEPPNSFYAAKNIGLVCGKVNGSLEVIDIDIKHDPDGTIFDRYTSTIDRDILDLLVIQQTKSGGSHLIYRSPIISGNKKLAINAKTNEAIIETRGEGGYIVIAPSPGYKFVQYDLSDIPTLTQDQRNHLISQAMQFNEVEETVHYPDNCFKDYNERGNVLALLQSHGWTIKKDNGDKVLLKRPGETDSLWSADYTRSKNWFTVFSTSTVFESLKAYKPANVFAILECDGDFKATAKLLKEQGFGVADWKPLKPDPTPEPKKVQIPENFVATEAEPVRSWWLTSSNMNCTEGPTMTCTFFSEGWMTPEMPALLIVGSSTSARSFTPTRRRVVQ